MRKIHSRENGNPEHHEKKLRKWLFWKCGTIREGDEKERYVGKQ